MSAPGRWADLAARMGSGLVMVLVGLAAVAAGGDIFHVFVALICGAMIWELVRMLAPDQTGPALWLGALVAAAMLLAIYLPPAFALPVLLAPAFVGFSQIEDNRAPFMIFSVGILLAGYGMMSVRDEFGFVWMLWLVLVVVATDVAGYFAGKSLGGPQVLAQGQPQQDLVGHHCRMARRRGGGAGLRALAGHQPRPGRRCRWRCRWPRRWATSRKARSSAGSGSRMPAR